MFFLFRLALSAERSKKRTKNVPFHTRGGNGSLLFTPEHVICLRRFFTQRCAWAATCVNSQPLQEVFSQRRSSLIQRKTDCSESKKKQT